MYMLKQCKNHLIKIIMEKKYCICLFYKILKLIKIIFSNFIYNVNNNLFTKVTYASNLLKNLAK